MSRRAGDLKRHGREGDGRERNDLAGLEVRSQQGTITATVDLDPAVFGLEPNVAVMHQVVTAQLAAARAGTQSTKTRAEVSGGGAKPYRQKGTGRARQGSTRAPHYAGGGVALGPKPRSYRQRTPRKMVQLALRSALSDRASAGQVVVVEGWDWEVPSTKDAQASLSTLGLAGRVLVVLSRDDERAFKSFRNLAEVDLVLAPELSAYDVLCSDWVVFTRGTLPGDSTWGEAPAQPTIAVQPTTAVQATATTTSATAVPTTEAEPEPGAEAGDADDEAGDEVAAVTKTSRSRPTRAGTKADEEEEAADEANEPVSAGATEAEAGAVTDAGEPAEEAGGAEPDDGPETEDEPDE